MQDKEEKDMEKINSATVKIEKRSNSIADAVKSNSVDKAAGKKKKKLMLSSIPLMGFGTYLIDSPDSIINAFKIGYRHFDLAESYRNLEIVKIALTTALLPVCQGGLGIRREEIWLTMKLSKINSSDHINSLLVSVGTEYFDLVLYHYPFEHFGSKEQLKYSWQQLSEHMNVRKIGVSNFYCEHLTRLIDICTEFDLQKPFANEIQLNLYVFAGEKDLIALCERYNISLLAYCPLGFFYSHALLSSKELVKISRELGASPAQVALAWLMAKNISVIPKSNNYIRQEENFKSTDIIAEVRSMSEQLDLISSSLNEEDFLISTSLDSKDHAKGLKW